MFFFSTGTKLPVTNKESLGCEICEIMNIFWVLQTKRFWERTSNFRPQNVSQEQKSKRMFSSNGV